MRNKSFFIIIALLVLGLIGYAGKSLAQAAPIPDTPEAKEIIKTIERAYDIQAEAAYTFDLKKFPDVFINDPRYPLPPSTLQVVREMTDNLALESAGYLDYKMAYYSHWRDGALKLEELKAKAKSENRKLTKEEIKSLVDPYGRPAASRAMKGTRNKPVNIITIEMIGDDVAMAEVNDGPTTSQLTLVLVDGKWYIANRIILSVHP